MSTYDSYIRENKILMIFRNFSFSSISLYHFLNGTVLIAK